MTDECHHALQHEPAQSLRLRSAGIQLLSAPPYDQQLLGWLLQQPLAWLLRQLRSRVRALAAAVDPVPPCNVNCIKMQVTQIAWCCSRRLADCCLALAH